jgi:ATP/maltotriose-dependent transcriptional regulator MalT
MVGSDDLLARLSQSLMPQERMVVGGVSTTLPVAPLTHADAVLSLRDALRSLRHRSVCIVVDGLDKVHDHTVLRSLAELLQECTTSTSKLVVTCRSLNASIGCAPTRLWLVDEQDLKFRFEEARELLELASASRADEAVVSRLIARSSGQPALIDLLARHPQLHADSWDGVPQDLVWHVESVVDGLEDAEMAALYVAALLGEGPIAEASGMVRLNPAEWSKLSLVVPLLEVRTHESTGQASFRVHAVLTDVLSTSAANRLPPDELVRLRGQVLAILRSRGDYPRMVSVLAQHCGQVELRESVDVLGPSLLHSVGPVALGHLLDLLPASEIAASPRLLLLAAAVMREQERLTEALERATLARSMADCREDWAVFVDSSLLVSRIGLDVG